MRLTIIEPRTPLEERYVRQMRAEGWSEETIRQRIYVLRMLDADPATATVEDVARVIDRPLAATTKATYLRVLRMIFVDMNRLGWIDNDPARLVRSPRTPRRRPRPLPAAEVEALLGMGHEDALAWTVLGLFAGLRSGEVVTLTGNSLQDSVQGPVVRVVGKGRLDAVIPAHPRVVEILAPHRGSDGLLWPIWGKSMVRRWGREARAVGVHGRAFHQLRHTYATRLYSATGGDLLTVAALCRHASVATTQGYAQVADERPFSAIAAL